MSNKFLENSTVNDYAREQTLENIETVLFEGINVSSTSLALESGGNLDVISGDTTSLDTKLPSQGQALMAASLPVVLASDQTAVPITSTTLALETGGNLLLTQQGVSSMDLKMPAQGQTLMAGSMPVVLASNQTAVPITSTTLAIESGGNLDVISGDTTSLDTKIPAQGQAAMASSLPVVIANNQSAVPVSSTTLALESGGNLAIIAGDTTSLDAKVPVQGQSLMTESMPVVISSDQSNINTIVVDDIFAQVDKYHVNFDQTFYNANDGDASFTQKEFLGSGVWSFNQIYGLQTINDGSDTVGNVWGSLIIDKPLKIKNNYEVVMKLDLTNSVIISGAGQNFRSYFGCSSDFNLIGQAINDRFDYAFIHNNGSWLFQTLFLGDLQIPISSFNVKVPDVSEFLTINTFFFINYNGKFMTGKILDDGTRELWHVVDYPAFINNDVHTGFFSPYTLLFRTPNGSPTIEQQSTLISVTIKENNNLVFTNFKINKDDHLFSNSKMRVINNNLQFSSNFQIDEEPLKWDLFNETNVSTIEYNTSLANVSMISDTPATDSISYFLSRKRFDVNQNNITCYFNYRGWVTTPTDNPSNHITIGLFNKDVGFTKGIFYNVSTDGTATFNMSSSSHTISVLNENWVFKKIIPDTTVYQTLVIDINRLNKVVRFGFIINNEIEYYHCIGDLPDNNLYFPNRPLPCNFKINSAGTDQITMIINSVDVSHDNINNQFPLIRSVYNNATLSYSSGSIYAVSGIRYKTTATKFPKVKLTSGSILVTSASEELIVSLFLDPVVGGVETFTDQTNSTVRTLNQTNTNTVTGGTILYSEFLSNNTGGDSLTHIKIPENINILYNLGGLYLCVEPISATINLTSLINWSEEN